MSTTQHPEALRDARWYMLNKMGMATLCANKADAQQEAADAQRLWPHMGPHRAAQLVEAADAPQDSFDHGPQATSIEEAARDVGKWLNERPNRPIDLRHVAMLCAHAQAAPAAVAGVDEREAFEAWALAQKLGDYTEQMGFRFHDASDGYPAWRAWQARAVLARGGVRPAPQQEAASVDLRTMELAESVGLIGPASRSHDLHAAIQRFHDLICANATIKAAQMAAEAISEAAPQQEPGKAVHQFRKQHCAEWYDGHADHGDGRGPYEERTLYTIPQQEAQEPVTWRELCRRLYVELFCCDQQMTSGKRPKWQQGKTVRDVLADAKAALDAAPQPSPAPGKSFQTYAEANAYSKGYYAGKKSALSQTVPLTDERIRDWWASENGLEDCEMCKLTDFTTVVRAVEEKHGITGGQHGAE